MREFNISLKEIFSGLDPEEIPNKTKPNISSCFNLVPTGTTYMLHSLITDLNPADVWKDHGEDNWKDNDTDVWKDNP